MGTAIWNVLYKILIFFAGLWNWLITPFDLSNFKIVEDILYSIGLTELTPLGFFSVSFFSFLLIYKLVRLLT